MSRVKVFAINEAEHLSEYVSLAIQSAPKYGVQVVSAIKHTIRVIHGIPGVHDTLKLDDLDVYLGRSTPRNVVSRWREHQKEKRHLYGAVLFSCSATISLKLEKLALKLLDQLRRRKSLCVGMANAIHDSRGNRPGEDTGVIYLTWGKTLESTNYGRPTMPIIREIAEAVCRMNPEIGLEISRKQLENALGTAKAPLTAKARLYKKIL